MSIIQSARPKTPTEQMCYDTGYQQGMADAVAHGRWVQGDMYDIGDVCSVCGHDSRVVRCTDDYCSSCGARMNEEA